VRRAVLALVALAACAAPRGAVVADVAGQVVFGAIVAADYAQTVRIVRDGQEGNPIIGRDGQNVPPGIYFPAAFILHTAVAFVLPRPWRNVWQATWGVGVSTAVWNNWVEGYPLP